MHLYKLHIYISEHSSYMHIHITMMCALPQVVFNQVFDQVVNQVVDQI